MALVTEEGSDVDAAVVEASANADAELDSLRTYVHSLASYELCPVDNRPFDIAKLKLNSREYRYRNLIESVSGNVSDFLETHVPKTEEEILALRVFYLLHQTGHINVSQEK